MFQAFSRPAAARARSVVAALAIGAACTAAPHASGQATAWKPEKNVEIVVGLGPGSNQDRIARAIQRIWQEKALVPTTVSVANRVGGGGNVAWAFMAQRAGDPHYFQIVSSTMLTNHIIGTSTFHHADFTAVAMLGTQYIAHATRTEGGLRSGRELVDRMKADPAGASFGINSGLGNNLHIAIALVAKSAGADPRRLRIAVFQGNELMTAALGGHVEVIATVASNILPHMQAGKLRMLGVAAPQRLGGAMAEVPTWKEQGIDAVVPNFAGILGTRGMTPAQLAFWDGVFAKTAQTDEWKRELAANQWEGQYLSAADAAAYMRADYAKLKGVLTELGMAK